MQDRAESGQIMTFIEHQAIDRFIINTHALHNAHLLRATLPRHLVVPIPLHQDRRAKHNEIVENLRSTQEIKRATTKARAAQKKLGAANSVDDSGPGPKKRKRSQMGSELEVANGVALDGILDSGQQEIFEEGAHALRMED